MLRLLRLPAHLQPRGKVAVCALSGFRKARNMKKQIFAVSGKFFVNAWEEPKLQQHLLSLSEKPAPRISYVGAAVGDNPYEMEIFYRQMNQHECRLTHLSLFEPHTADFESYFNEHDIVYVNGGATRNLVVLAREWGLDKALRSAWENGVILSGTSAGAICWFESCITDSLPKKLLPQKCFGFLKGSASTHYDARPDRPEMFTRYLKEGSIVSPGYALDDHTAMHFIDTSLHEIVSAKAGAKARILIVKDGMIDEKFLAVREL